MSRVVIPPAYNEMIISFRSGRRRDPFGVSVLPRFLRIANFAFRPWCPPFSDTTRYVSSGGALFPDRLSRTQMLRRFGLQTTF